jgi:hypothetical protein
MDALLSDPPSTLDDKRSPLDPPLQLHPTVDARQGSKPEPADVPTPPEKPASLRAFDKGLTPPKMEKPPQPDQGNDPKGKWGGSATQMASLSGKQVQQRMIDAFKAATTAMGTLQSQPSGRWDQSVIGRGRTEGRVWQVATENAIALAEYQNKAYGEALATFKKNPTDANAAEAKAQLTALSAAFEDPIVKQTLDQRGVKGVENLQKVRSSAVEGTKTATQEIADHIAARYEKLIGATGRLPSESEQALITDQERKKDPEYQRLISSDKPEDVAKALRRLAALGDDKAMEKLATIEASKTSKEDQRAFSEKQLNEKQAEQEKLLADRQAETEKMQKDREAEKEDARKEREAFEEKQKQASEKFQDDERKAREAFAKAMYEQRNPFEKKGVAKALADGIKKGDQPPILTGLYGLSGPVRAELEAQGFDLTKAQLQWDAAKKQVQSLNGPQQMRLVGLSTSVVNTIDEVKRLSKDMELSGIPLVNKAELASYIQLQGNSENGQLAARYIGAVNTLKEEFANLANGGYAPTEASWALANQQIDSNYGVKELGSALEEVQRLINYRMNAIPGLGTMGPRAANRYTGATGEAEPSSPESPSPNAAVTVKTPDDVTKLPPGTKFVIPDGPHKGEIRVAP